MTQGGATLAGWSVKDILAHLVAWQQWPLASSLRQAPSRQLCYGSGTAAAG
jgi:hypothetical protein